MRLSSLLLILLAAAAGAQDANYKLVFEDNFDGDKLNTETWVAESAPHGQGNRTEQAVTVKDGLLKITTWNDNTGTFTGYIRMKRTRFFAFRQGKVEGRIRFNPAQGITSSFELGTDEAESLKSQVTVTIFSVHGYEQGLIYNTSLSWKRPGETLQKIHQPQKISVAKFWHTYVVEWDDNGYRFMLDGKVRFTTKESEGTAGQRGIELGCGLPSLGPKGGYGPKDKSKATYEIDWVRVWERVPAAK
jgi:hypothetical protein